LTRYYWSIVRRFNLNAALAASAYSNVHVPSTQWAVPLLVPAE
jgi:hypothetical protein